MWGAAALLLRAALLVLWPAQSDSDSDSARPAPETQCTGAATEKETSGSSLAALVFVLVRSAATESILQFIITCPSSATESSRRAAHGSSRRNVSMNSQHASENNSRPRAARLGSAQLGPVQLSSARPAQLSSARRSSARLSSAQLSSGRRGSPAASSHMAGAARANSRPPIKSGASSALGFAPTARRR